MINSAESSVRANGNCEDTVDGHGSLNLRSKLVPSTFPVRRDRESTPTTKQGCNIFFSSYYPNLGSVRLLTKK